MCSSTCPNMTRGLHPPSGCCRTLGAAPPCSGTIPDGAHPANATQLTYRQSLQLALLLGYALVNRLLLPTQTTQQATTA